MEKDLELLNKLNKSKPEEVKSENDYMGRHRPPKRNYGAPLYDLTKIYPDDVYEKMMQYGDFSQKEASSTILRHRGKPDSFVQIYRAVPKGITEINTGDWVAITKSYAILHSKHPTDPSEDLDVISAKVFAKDLFTEGNSFEEWGYQGESIKGVLV